MLRIVLIVLLEVLTLLVPFCVCAGLTACVLYNACLYAFQEEALNMD